MKYISDSVAHIHFRFSKILTSQNLPGFCEIKFPKYSKNLIYGYLLYWISLFLMMNFLIISQGQRWHLLRKSLQLLVHSDNFSFLITRLKEKRSTLSYWYVLNRVYPKYTKLKMLAFLYNQLLMEINRKWLPMESILLINFTTNQFY